MRITNAPAVGRHYNGRLVVFARGEDGHLWYIEQREPVSGPPPEGTDIRGLWSEWSALHKSHPQRIDLDPLPEVASTVAVARRKDECLEVFACDEDGHLWHIRQSKPNGGWHAWSQLPWVWVYDPIEMVEVGWRPLKGVPAVGMDAQECLEVLVRGEHPFDPNKDGIWYIRQTQQSGDHWSEWSFLKAAATWDNVLPGAFAVGDPALGRNDDGRLEAFARGADGNLYHTWQTSGSPGMLEWWEWNRFFGPSDVDFSVAETAPTVCLDLNRCLLLATQDESRNSVGWFRQSGPNNGWLNWDSQSLWGLGAPTLAQNADNRLAMFYWQTGFTLRAEVQDRSGEGFPVGLELNAQARAYTAPSGHCEAPAVGQNAYGGLEVFARGKESELLHIWQKNPRGWARGDWSDWSTL